MLADLIAASTAPAAPGPHDAYDWWSDIWLPAIVGLGSLAIAGVAVRVAARSNRLAAAATKAAAKSNAIAERAVRQETERAAEQRAEATRQERRRLANRFLASADMLSAEMLADPSMWSRPIAELDGAAIFDVTPIMFEAGVRGWTDFPSSKAIDFITMAARAGGGVVRTQHARNAVHMMVNSWVEDKGTLEAMIEYIEQGLEKQLS